MITRQKKLFADVFMEHGDIGRAAIAAGFRPNCARKVGAKLVDDKDVRRYIAVKESKGKTKVTKESLTDELNAVIALAKESNQAPAMVGALKVKAQIHGFLKESEVSVTTTTNHVSGDFPGLDERIREIVAAELADALQ